jgi:hypothetical protein
MLWQCSPPYKKLLELELICLSQLASTYYNKMGDSSDNPQGMPKYCDNNHNFACINQTQPPPDYENRSLSSSPERNSAPQSIPAKANPRGKKLWGQYKDPRPKSVKGLAGKKAKKAKRNVPPRLGYAYGRQCRNRERTLRQQAHVSREEAEQLRLQDKELVTQRARKNGLTYKEQVMADYYERQSHSRENDLHNSEMEERERTGNVRYATYDQKPEQMDVIPHRAKCDEHSLSEAGRSCDSKRPICGNKHDKTVKTNEQELKPGLEQCDIDQGSRNDSYPFLPELVEHTHIADRSCNTTYESPMSEVMGVKDCIVDDKHCDKPTYEKIYRRKVPKRTMSETKAVEIPAVIMDVKDYDIIREKHAAILRAPMINLENVNDHLTLATADEKRKQIIDIHKMLNKLEVAIPPCRDITTSSHADTGTRKITSSFTVIRNINEDNIYKHHLGCMSEGDRVARMHGITGILLSHVRIRELILNTSTRYDILTQVPGRRVAKWLIDYAPNSLLQGESDWGLYEPIPRGHSDILSDRYNQDWLKSDGLGLVCLNAFQTLWLLGETIKIWNMNDRPWFKHRNVTYPAATCIVPIPYMGIFDLSDPRCHGLSTIIFYDASELITYNNCPILVGFYNVEGLYFMCKLSIIDKEIVCKLGKSLDHLFHYVESEYCSNNMPCNLLRNVIPALSGPEEFTNKIMFVTSGYDMPNTIYGLMKLADDENYDRFCTAYPLYSPERQHRKCMEDLSQSEETGEKCHSMNNNEHCPKYGKPSPIFMFMNEVGYISEEYFDPNHMSNATVPGMTSVIPKDIQVPSHEQLQRLEKSLITMGNDNLVCATTTDDTGKDNSSPKAPVNRCPSCTQQHKRENTADLDPASESLFILEESRVTGETRSCQVELFPPNSASESAGKDCVAAKLILDNKTKSDGGTLNRCYCINRNISDSCGCLKTAQDIQEIEMGKRRRNKGQSKRLLQVAPDHYIEYPAQHAIPSLPEVEERHEEDIWSDQATGINITMAMAFPDRVDWSDRKVLSQRPQHYMDLAGHRENVSTQVRVDTACSGSVFQSAYLDSLGIPELASMRIKKGDMEGLLHADRNAWLHDVKFNPTLFTYKMKMRAACLAQGRMDLLRVATGKWTYTPYSVDKDGVCAEELLQATFARKQLYEILQSELVLNGGMKKGQTFIVPSGWFMTVGKSEDEIMEMRTIMLERYAAGNGNKISLNLERDRHSRNDFFAYVDLMSSYTEGTMETVLGRDRCIPNNMPKSDQEHANSIGIDIGVLDSTMSSVKRYDQLALIDREIAALLKMCHQGLPALYMAPEKCQMDLVKALKNVTRDEKYLDCEQEMEGREQDLRFVEAQRYELERQQLHPQPDPVHRPEQEEPQAMAGEPIVRNEDMYEDPEEQGLEPLPIRIRPESDASDSEGDSTNRGTDSSASYESTSLNLSSEEDGTDASDLEGMARRKRMQIGTPKTQPDGSTIRVPHFQCKNDPVQQNFMRDFHEADSCNQGLTRYPILEDNTQMGDPLMAERVRSVLVDDDMGPDYTRRLAVKVGQCATVSSSHEKALAKLYTARTAYNELSTEANGLMDQMLDSRPRGSTDRGPNRACWPRREPNRLDLNPTLWPVVRRYYEAIIVDYQLRCPDTGATLTVTMVHGPSDVKSVDLTTEVASQIRGKSQQDLVGMSQVLRRETLQSPPQPINDTTGNLDYHSQDLTRWRSNMIAIHDIREVTMRTVWEFAGELAVHYTCRQAEQHYNAVLEQAKDWRNNYVAATRDLIGVAQACVEARTDGLNAEVGLCSLVMEVQAERNSVAEGYVPSTTHHKEIQQLTATVAEMAESIASLEEEGSKGKEDSRKLAEKVQECIVKDDSIRSMLRNEMEVQKAMQDAKVVQTDTTARLDSLRSRVDNLSQKMNGASIEDIARTLDDCGIRNLSQIRGHTTPQSTTGTRPHSSSDESRPSSGTPRQKRVAITPRGTPNRPTPKMEEEGE